MRAKVTMTLYFVSFVYTSNLGRDPLFGDGLFEIPLFRDDKMVGVKKRMDLLKEKITEKLKQEDEDAVINELALLNFFNAH